MRDSYIPYGGYWSTPFAKWQGALSHLNSVKFAAHVARAELDDRRIDATEFDTAILGMTIPQHRSFYGTPWMTAMIGADRLTGPTVSQACATSARCLRDARGDIATDDADAVLMVTTDRTSNAPTLSYPEPSAQGGRPVSEHWIIDNFNNDPHAGLAMVETAENVARKWQITTSEQHDVVLRRHEQYQEAAGNGGAFHRRYMRLPFEVPDRKFSGISTSLDGDEGVYPTSRDKLASLKPVLPGGTVTFASQTHPADGSAAMIVATRDRAREMSRDPGIEVRVAAVTEARTEKGHMPHAPVPASQKALDAAEIRLEDVAAVKTHNPFAVNDIVFCRETGYDISRMNNFGCSLIWGHPQGPTGLRAICELIEELALRGGGYGLFNGCAAGDSAMAAIFEVRDADPQRRAKEAPATED